MKKIDQRWKQTGMRSHDGRSLPVGSGHLKDLGTSSAGDDAPGSVVPRRQIELEERID